ncbi:hypothetical protein HY504_00060 [Candidatus Wolfebacteria bacterium]|nr:hypothetical protein [Candidatus Wolfebacteria bacterium]
MRPHLNSPDFPQFTDENLKKMAVDISDPIYAIDDQTAIKVDNKEIEIISEGKYLTYNLK